MKAILSRPFFRKYGKKALVIYLCWCLLKGVLFLLAGWLLVWYLDVTITIRTKWAGCNFLEASFGNTMKLPLCHSLLLLNTSQQSRKVGKVRKVRKVFFIEIGFRIGFAGRQAFGLPTFGLNVQDMPSLYFALLHIAPAVEECDARNDAIHC